MYRLPTRGLECLVLFLLILGCGGQLFGQGAKITNPGKLIEGPKERREDDQTLIREREKWFMKRRQAPPGESPAGARIKAFRQKQALRLANEQRFQKKRVTGTGSSGNAVLDGATSTRLLPNSTPLFNQPWTALGPTPIGHENSGYGDVTGRVTAIAIDQTDTTGNTVYVGGAYGGVWKSTDAARVDTGNITWTPITDTQASLAANAIAISPFDHNIILVGTGEPDFAGDSYYGVGILRSSDGGTNWTLITQTQNGANQFKGMGVSKIAWSTANPNLVVAAFSNATIRNYGGGTSGLYYSTDAGATWQLGIFNTNRWSDASDVVYNSATNTFYAAMEFQGIFSSIDGITWNLLPNQPFDAGYLLRASLASHPTKNEIYAIGVDYTGTTLDGLARSLDGGVTWIQLNPAGILNCGDGGGCGVEQGAYDLVLAAVPNGANTDLYVGAVNLYRCTNAATTNCAFKNLTHVYSNTRLGPHPDNHSFDYLRSTPTTLFIGNDGGVWRSTNGLVGTGASAVQNLNAGLGSLSQFVSMSQHPWDSNVLLGGLQDNGSPARDSAHFNDTLKTPQQTWVNIAGGDGGYNAINQTSPNLWSQEFVYVSIGQCNSSQMPGNDPHGTTGGCIPNNINPSVVSANGAHYLGVPQNFSDEGQFYTPFILDPANQSKLIIGTCRVWRGNADGSGWAVGSQANALYSRSNETFCDGSEPAVSSLAAGGPSIGGVSSVIYAGMETGEIYSTTNSGLSWYVGGPAGALAIADIAILGGNSGDGLTAFAVSQNFAHEHVWKTTDSGGLWRDITGNLPDVPTSAIVIDPGDTSGNTLYVGTDLGVFYTMDGGLNWVEYGPSSGAGAFPNAPVTRLLAFSVGGHHLLRASTYGRGVWQNVLAPNFSLSVSNPTQTAFTGQHRTLNGTLSLTNDYKGTVTLSCAAGAPPTCSVTPSGTNSGGNFSVDVESDHYAPFSFNIEATDGTIVRDFPVSLNVLDYTVSVTGPQPIAILRGTSNTASVHLQAHGPFTAPVTFSCPTPPGGVSCTPVTLSTQPYGSATGSMTITANSLASPGSYTVTLKGDTAGATRTAPLQLDLQENPGLFDFAIANVAPASRTVLPGGSAVYSVSMSPLGGFNNTINLTCQIVTAPAGASCSFDQTALGADSISHLTVGTSGTTPPGTYTVQLTGTAGTRTHSKNVKLIVNTSDFTLNGAPALQVTAGDGAGTNYALTLGSVDGFASPVFLTCNGLPTDLRANGDVSCSSRGSTLPSGVPVNILFRAGSRTTPGSYSIQVVGYSLSPYLVHTMPVTLTVAPPPGGTPTRAVRLRSRERAVHRDIPRVTSR